MSKNKTIGIKSFMLMVLLLAFVSANAQFYTLRADTPMLYKVRNDSVEKEKSITSDTLVSEVEDKKNNVIGSPELWCSSPLANDLYITSAYGYRIDPITGKRRFHHGVDIRCKNDKVQAIFSGKV